MPVEPRTRSVDINADLGESFGRWQLGADQVLMRAISSASVACGFHAGDPITMQATVLLAKRESVSIGAHPGLPDLLGFGRRNIDVAPADAAAYAVYQTGALAAFCRAAGVDLHHVKLHGALYMMALEDAALARAIAEAIAGIGELPVYTLAGSEMWDAAAAAGLQPVPEFFADRPLHKDGSVLMFGWQEHFEATPETVSERVRSLMRTGTVRSLEGDMVPISPATICLHSDTPGAGEIGIAVRAAIEAEGVLVSGRLSRDPSWPQTATTDAAELGS